MTVRQHSDAAVTANRGLQVQPQMVRQEVSKLQLLQWQLDKCRREKESLKHQLEALTSNPSESGEDDDRTVRASNPAMVEPLAPAQVLGTPPQLINVPLTPLM